MCCCSSTMTPSGTFCLSPCAHTRIRVAVCCLHDVLRTYLGVLGHSAPPRRRSWPGLRSPLTHTRVRAAVCCLQDVRRIYLGAACAAAPPRTTQSGTGCSSPCAHTRIRAAVRCLLGVLRIYRGCSLYCDSPGGSLCCSPFRGDTTGYVLFVAVHVSTHTSSCVLSP